MAADTCEGCGGLGRLDVGRKVDWRYDYRRGYWKAEYNDATLLVWHDPTHPDGPGWMWCAQREGKGDVHGKDSQRWKAKTLAEKEAGV